MCVNKLIVKVQRPAGRVGGSR